MRVDEHGNIIFSSGRYLSPNCGIVGLSHDGMLAGGYDQMENTTGDEAEDLSDRDLVELSDIMIERWQRFRAARCG